MVACKLALLVKVKYFEHVWSNMARAKMRKTKTSRTPPLMSSAGIMRYFEEERTQIKFNPKSILIFGFVVGVLVIMLNAYYGLWPG